jgi:prevent-host-death family protein
MTTIGAFEAKTKLSELLDRVERGEEIVITRHGKPAARLVPPVEAQAPRAKRATADEMLAIGRKFRALVTGEFSSADIDKILYDADGLPK